MIPAALREEAVQICDMMASSCADDYPSMPAWDLSNIQASKAAVKFTGAFYRLLMTRGYKSSVPVYYNCREWWAEAAQLLRDGWDPGDDFEFRATASDADAQLAQMVGDMAARGEEIP